MSLAEIDFDTPEGHECNQLVMHSLGEYAVGKVVRRYPRRFFATVISCSKPPDSFPSARAFPTDMFIAHASPRWLNYQRENWRFAKHEYSVSQYGMDFRSVLHRLRNTRATYMHIDVAIPGLRNGDVVAMTGDAVVVSQMDEEGKLRHGWTAGGVMGTTSCPWFVLNTIDVYRNWPSEPVTVEAAADALAQLRAYIGAPALTYKGDDLRLAA